MEAHHSNIEEETLKNNFYRKVLYTGKKMQLVLMSLRAGEEIPEEIHPHIDQFFRIEKGVAEIIINGKKYKVKEDEVIIVPAGAKHYVKNASDKDLKLYTIYTPPEHKDGTVHKTMKEALEHHH